VLLALTGYEVALLCVAAVFIAFALIAAAVIPRTHPDFPGRHLWVFVGICAALFVAQIAAVLVDATFAGEEEAAAIAGAPPEKAPPPETTAPTETTTSTPTETTETTGTTETAPAPAGDPAAGKEVFLTVAQPPCGGCHTLADAGSAGSIGPNLDQRKPSYDKVVDRVTNGLGVMPSFKSSLTAQQIQDVAAYVSSVAGS